MKAFVTGATGFVGSHVARALVEQGADLRLLVRSTSRTDNIADLKADRVVGDLREPESLKKSMSGCEFVFHVAADYRLWVRDPDEMYRANVEGTRAIISAAQQSGVRRVIYTSSVATTPIGGMDIKPTPTGRIIVDFLKRKFPAYVDTGLNLADASEVARGHLLAMEKAVPGERYILGGENLTLKQILDKLSALTGLLSPTMKVPHTVAMGFAVFDQFFTGVIRGKEPRATVDAVKMGRKKMFASSAKAERELGYKVLPVEDALRRAINWFQTHGYVEAAGQIATAGA